MSLPFILYASAGKRELADATRRGEHGSIDEAVAALEWLKRLERVVWGVVVRADDNLEVWIWEVEKPARARKTEET